MSGLPEIQKGSVLGFITCTAEVIDFRHVPNPGDGFQEKYILLLRREDAIVPYLVCQLHPRGWAYKEWDFGHYFSDPQNARLKFQELVDRWI
jgi:hypothetical protein